MTGNTIIEVKKNPNETNAGLLRRFSRRVQESGIVRKVKNNRYAERVGSKLTQKKAALKKLGKRKEMDRLIKLGKMQSREEMQNNFRR